MALFRSGQEKLTKADALKALRDGTFADRDELSRLLHFLGSQRSLEPVDLLPLLTRKNPTLRAFAEVQMGRRLDSRSLDGLLKKLPSMTQHSQSMLLHVVLRSKPNLVLPAVRKMVEGDASEALSMQVLDAMASLPGHVVGREFLSFLSHDKADVRHMALVKVTESSEILQQPGLLTRLVAMADDPEQRIRLRILDLVDDVEPGEAVRICLGMLRDEAPQVQQKAVRSLATSLERLESSSEAAEDQLFALLTDGSEAVRGGVVEILMKRPDRERLLRKLLLFCKGVVGWVRDRTLDSLRLHASGLTGSVIRLMDDDDEDVRTMALLLGATLEAPEAVPHIARLLTDDDWWLRMIAAETLGKIGDRRAVGGLITAIDDAECGQAAIEALARIGDERAVVPIARQLSSPRAEVRVEAIDALRRLGDQRVIPVLDQCSERDPTASIRDRARAAADALGGGASNLATSGSYRIPAEHRSQTIEGLRPLERLLLLTRERGGSDLHLVVGSPPAIRINGRLQRLEGSSLDDDTVRGLLQPILEEKDRAVLDRDHQVDLCHAVREVGRYRCNIYEESKGLAGSFRVIPNDVPTLDDIGLPAHLGDLVNYHQGLVVVAGPSGSGKSTTLAALVNLFNEQRRSHILCLEDPIEFVHPAKGSLVTQRQVQRHTESFATALRGALRQDPDIIVVGQMRDPETVRLAIEASETGHLVIGTMNTTSAYKTVDRIVDSFPVSEQSQIRTMLSETLKAVIAQQLLPAGDGAGRVACFEVMMGTLDVRMLIRDGKTFQIPGQMQIGERWGHVTLDKALARLLEAGRISAEQAWQRAQSKELFEAKLDAEFLAGTEE